MQDILYFFIQRDTVKCIYIIRIYQWFGTKVEINGSLSISITTKCNIYPFNFLSGFIKFYNFIANFAHIIYLKDLIELFFIMNTLFGRMIDYYMHAIYIHRLSALMQNDLTASVFIIKLGDNITVDHLIRATYEIILPI